MPRLFHKSEWFHELSPNALAETEFESLLIQNSDIVRPNTSIVPYKKTVYAGERSARADLAIISHDYRKWTVVEVEMLRHDLHRHVVPQIDTLRNGRYEQTHAEYLAARAPHLDAGKISQMLRGEPPEVLVIVNKYDEEWARELRRYGAHMMVFEIYRSPTSNRHIFSIDGNLPVVAQDILTELSFGLLPRLLTVKSPAALDFQHGERVAVFIGEQVTYWERFDTATECYITPVRSMPIQPGQRYALARKDEGDYVIRPLNVAGG